SELDEGKARRLQGGEIHVQVGDVLERKAAPGRRQGTEALHFRVREAAGGVLTQRQDQGHAALGFGLRSNGVEKAAIAQRFGGNGGENRACAAALAQPVRYPCRADHPCRVHARNEPAALKTRGLDGGTVGGKETRADFEVSCPALVEAWIDSSKTSMRLAASA